MQSKNNGRCVIIGGADIKNHNRIKSLLFPNDYFVFCDSGLKHATPLGITPSLIVGDFDSHPLPQTDTETIVLPKEKDDTDTVFGVKESIARGFESFLIIGAVGGRLDHTLGNVGILDMLYGMGKKALVADDFSEISIVGREKVKIEKRFSYFSLLNIYGTAKGINITDAKYPLTDGVITTDYQYGISNESLPEKEATVWVTDGKLLLIKVY